MPSDVVGTNVFDPRAGGVPLPAGAGLLPRAAGGRDQPGAGQDPGRAAGGDGGAPVDGRRRGSPAPRSVPGAGDAEPGRVRGHLPVARRPSSIASCSSCRSTTARRRSSARWCGATWRASSGTAWSRRACSQSCSPADLLRLPGRSWAAMADRAGRGGLSSSRSGGRRAGAGTCNSGAACVDPWRWRWERGRWQPCAAEPTSTPDDVKELVRPGAAAPDHPEAGRGDRRADAGRRARAGAGRASRCRADAGRRPSPRPSPQPLPEGEGAFAPSTRLRQRAVERRRSREAPW